MKPKLIGLRIDLETRSRVNIKDGAYKYAEDPDFRVLVNCYSPLFQYPGGAVKLGRVRPLPLDNPSEVEKFTKIILDPRFQKHAFNATFERVCLSKWVGMPDGTYIDPTNWRCSAVRANVHGVFGTLAEVARAVRSPITKDPEGKRLINMFSVPQKDGEFINPADHRGEFKRFVDYCCQDVVTEAVVASAFPDPPDLVQHEYEMDQRINDRGIGHNKKLALQAVAQVKVQRDATMAQLKVLTGLDNPNSNQQMQAWLNEHGYPMVSLDKAHRAQALADPMVPDEVAEVLVIKGEASLSSVTKHQAALNTRCKDGRIRGSLRFYGAHTGREAGRGIQPQNMPRYQAPREDRLRLLAGEAGADAARIAKGTIRASLVPRRGNVFIAPDYNAIEARVLAGLADEKWAEAEFAGEGKIYEATAQMMFGVDKHELVRAISKEFGCDKCGKCENCATRSKGKVSQLALGYGGGAGALVTMGAEEAGIDIGNYNELHAEWAASGTRAKFHEWQRDRHDYQELLRLRDLYRDGSRATVSFWKLCERAWDNAALNGRETPFGQNQSLLMVRDGKHNRMILPSGRSIWYRFARTHMDPKDDERVEARTFIGKGTGVGHTRVETFGGRLCVSGNALVLTEERGWVELYHVTTQDRVWDGVEFVAHDGLIPKGEKLVIDVEGVGMTPDHLIMQRGGWREAQQYDRLDWQKVELPRGAWLLPMGDEDGHAGASTDMASSVRLRSGEGAATTGDTTGTARGGSQVLRLSDESPDSAGGQRRWRRTEQAPALRPVENGEVPMYQALSSGVGKLRRSWNHYVRPLASRLLGVRRGHGSDLPSWLGLGPDQQRRTLRPGELPVGASESKRTEPSSLDMDRLTVGPCGTVGRSAPIGDRIHNPHLSVGQGSATSSTVGGPEHKEEVYDLLNCGPRNRFTIMTERGPLLVHNCENIVQAVARDVLFDLIAKIEKLTASGWPGRTVFHVHDEVVLEVPKKAAEQVLADVLGLMSKPPEWGDFLVVKGEGDIMARYGK